MDVFIYVTQGLKNRRLLFLTFLFNHIYTAPVSKYFLQNQNILFLTEVILV